MNSLLASERSRWLFLIWLFSIGSGVSYGIFTNKYDPVDVSSAFQLEEEVVQKKLQQFIVGNHEIKSFIDLYSSNS
tara:strand:- start:1637 stop:1864 length:228 start_codon:yes stop_codon:yes gene_type:complete